MIDAHVHLVDFRQATPGAEALIAAMDASAIDKAVVFGLPVKKKWSATEPGEPTYYMDDIARCYYYSLTDELVADEIEGLPEEARSRLAPLACGVDPTDLAAVDELERTLERRPGFWRGIGELLLRHAELSSRLPDEFPRADHPGTLRIADLCERRGLPLVIHSNASAAGHEPEAYIHELETLLQASGATMVWAHAGISEIHREHDHVVTVSRLLDTYPHLNIDISWAGLDGILGDDGTPAGSWLELIERFPDRVMLGSDAVGRFDRLGPSIELLNSVLARLSPACGELVGHGNAERIFFGGV